MKKFPKRMTDMRMAPDVVATSEFECEKCGRKLSLSEQTDPSIVVRSMCHCGTVFELVPE